MPKVSIVIPTHNRPDLVGRAIRSVLAQTLSDIEIIVVDDGTALRAEREVQKVNDPRIRYIAHEKSLGAPAARNRGVHESSAACIAFLDDDDEWLPWKLERQLAGLSVNSEAVASYTSVAMFDEEGIKTDERRSGLTGVVPVFEATLRHPFIWTSALMVRREAFIACGGFDESFPKNQEWDLVLRLSERAPFFAIDDVGVHLHVLGEAAHLGGKKNIANIIRGHEMLLDKHRQAYACYPRAKGRVSFVLFCLFREAGDEKGMRRALTTAREAEPLNLVYIRHWLALSAGLRFYLFLARLWR